MNRNTRLSRSPLKRSRPRRVSMEPFWKAVTADGTNQCVMCVQEGRAVQCSPIIDAHHHVPKSRLPTDAAKLDPRNGMPLARWHHDQVTAGRMVSPRPPDLEAFLADHGLLESGRPIPQRRAA